MKNKKGFSLVECIVAIAIITVITTLAISSYQAALSNTSRQWGKYLTMVKADSALACFQSADDTVDFEKKLGITESDKVKGSTGSEQASVLYPVLSGITAYEPAADNNDKGKIVLKYNGSSSENFAYTDKSKYTADKSFLDNLSGTNGIYTATQQKKSSINNKNNEGAKVSYDGTKVGYDWSERVRGYTGDVTTKYSKTFDMSELEQYFFEKNIILGFAWENGYNDEIFISSGNGGSFYFYLYSTAGSTIKLYKTADDYCLILKVDVSSFSIGDDPNKWSESTDSVNVTNLKIGKIKENYVNGNTGILQTGSYITYYDLTQCFDDFNIPTSFKWYGLPTFAYACKTRSSFDRLSPNLAGGTIDSNGALVSTTYTLKTGDYKAIGYGLTKSSETVLYSHKDSRQLYKYTGGTVPGTLWTDFGFEDQGKENDYTKFAPHIDAAVETMTSYYSIPIESGYHCYIKTTFSSDRAVKPQIKTWILKENQIPDKNADDPVPSSNISEYLSYKKYI